jgi:outer membrane protein
VKADMTWRVSKWTGLLVGAVLISGLAHAQGTAMRIGVVNVARLLEQAPQAQAAMGALQTEFAPRQRDIVAIQRSLQEKQQTYDRDGQVMGEVERLSLEREIRDQQRDLEREQTDYLEDLNIRRNEELSKLQRSLLQQVQGHARDAGYDLVVADVLYYSSAIDITDEVLRGLEASFSTGNASP